MSIFDDVEDDQTRLVTLEEGLRAALVLDKLRVSMLNEAVDWIGDLTDLPIMDIRRHIADQKGGQVARSLATIKAVRSVLQDGEKQQNPS